MSFKISPNYTNISWIDLRISYDSDDNWNKAVDIIKDRFESRFFIPLEKLKKDEYGGFIIMSIDCLLIETFMQFYLGIGSTDKYPDYKGNQALSFRDFLLNSPHFKSEFKTEQICKIFYQHFRCGLLHQAQTKNNSKINIGKSEMLGLVDKDKISRCLLIDRNKFHKKLHKEFKDYLIKLKNNESNFLGQNFRKNCINKMDLICKEDT